MDDTIIINNMNDEEFKYQRKDFIALGIKEGSFGKLIKDLDLDNDNYRIFKTLPNGVNAKFFNQSAMDNVSAYLKEKGIYNSKTELALITENQELKKQLDILQKKYLLDMSIKDKQISDTQLEAGKLKDEWHEKEVQLLERNGSLIKEGVEKDKQIYETERKIDILASMNYWEFRKWKKLQTQINKNKTQY